MPLVEVLRDLLGDDGARSFQLMGEDLALVGGPALCAAAEAYARELERTVPASLRDEREAELAAAMREAHAWLRRHNRAMTTRVRGYLALGARVGFEYPWPIVAVLGIDTVRGGVLRTRVYGLLGRAAERVGSRALDELSARLDDVLLRTNRGIFADSVPAVLLGLRAHALRARGRADLAEALLDGPLPPLMDDEIRRLCRGLYDALAIEDGALRFRRLAALTLQHFAREQAIFTHHMGAGPARAPARPSRIAALVQPRSVPAPVVRRTRRGAELAFEPYPLPRGFAMEDHDARVEHFGRAFVESITRSVVDYRAATRWVLERFGSRDRSIVEPQFAAGPAPVVLDEH